MKNKGILISLTKFIPCLVHMGCVCDHRQLLVGICEQNLELLSSFCLVPAIVKVPFPV